MSGPTVAALAAQGPQGPAFRIRLALPGRFLAPSIELFELPLFAEDEALEFASGTVRTRVRDVAHARARLSRALAGLARPDVSVIQRQVDLLPTRSLETRAARARRVVYDIDDAVWEDARLAGGHPLALLKRSASKVSWLARRADQVIAGNDYIAEHVSAYNKHVEVVPSLIDVGGIEIRNHEDRGEIVLGWIGSASTARYLDDVLPILDGFAARLDMPVRLIVVGGHVGAAQRVAVEHRAWSPDAERQALADMDIGIMPLPDNSWTRGKCAYKALQYMAAGIPVIADRVGVTGDVVGDGDAGYTMPVRSDWGEGLAALAADPGLRQRLGAEGRRRIEERYSLARWAPRLRELWLG